MSSRRRRLVLTLLIVATTPLVLEGLVRVRAFVKYGPYDDVYDLFEEHPAGMLMARPDLAVDFARSAHIETDSRGFRSPELEDPKPPGTIRIAFLGGSTTFCGEARTNEATWPHLLVEALRADYPDVRFDYVNAGVTGASVETSRLATLHRLPEVAPDVVVIVHAAKDLADDTRAVAVERGVFEPPGSSWLEERSLLWMLARKNLRYRASQSAGRAAANKLDYDPDALAAAFGERLAALVRDARSLADVVVVATFPIKTRADQAREVQLDNLAQAFTFTPYLTPESVLAGYEAYNRAIADVAAETGAVLVGGEAGIPGTAEYFSDSVHFTEEGYRAMAGRFRSALRDCAAWRDLVARAAEEGTP